MFSAENDDDMVHCPYNSAHRMLRKRLQPHLIKCRQNYPHIELQKCPFNSTHLIPEPEFALHVTNCSDRKLITQYKYDAPEPKEEEKIKQAPIECDENWDDTEVQDFDPLKLLEQKNVLLKPVGIPSSQRKAFIKKERRRLGDGSSSSGEEDEDDPDADNEPKRSIQVIRKDEDTAWHGGRRYSVSPTPLPPKMKIDSFYPRARSRSPSRPIYPPLQSEYYRRVRGGGQFSSPSYAQPFTRRNNSAPTFYNGPNRRPSPPKNTYMGAYNIDDDPYYNSGRQLPQDGHPYGGLGSRNLQFQGEVNMYGAFRNVARPYPGRALPYGRGSFRGYPFDRRNGPTGRSDFGF